MLSVSKLPCMHWPRRCVYTHTQHTQSVTRLLCIDRNLLILRDTAVMGVGPGRVRVWIGMRVRVRVGIKFRDGVRLVHSSISMKVGKKKTVWIPFWEQIIPIKMHLQSGQLFPITNGFFHSSSSHSISATLCLCSTSALKSLTDSNKSEEMKLQHLFMNLHPFLKPCSATKLGW